MKGNALIRAWLHTDPTGISEEKWAQLFAEAIWIEQRHTEQLARAIAALFANRE